ncbi:nicotinate-nucleotide adenylyltransferase [Aquimarina gracilis]|uniref:Nicotinate-nucleotide adenylyltransferase n=1 Tax=Aquimarina gracilis TaxID=874422 RepID=A0ABU5ZTT4_9FLAO|nr:nicotinate-nucleotide adenylyltransferase [Aquimarina gracilis]MEB3345479.1 nicotinate-nucleotide adenylyltransferase [Aquimarina gracilis]
MKKIVLGLLVFGFTFQSFSQNVEQLAEVWIIATNYKYLSETDAEDEALPIELLQRKVATYDIKSSDIYNDEYDHYEVAFYIPEGKILAAYDKDGKVLRTVEKFKNVKLPVSVSQSIQKRFPGWNVTKDVYLVNFHDKKGVTKKMYKLRLENGDKLIRVKTDDEGNFL